jgi:hypothetical protein
MSSKKDKEYIARLEYQLAKAIERCEIAEEKLAHVSRLVTYGLEHPPSRYGRDAPGSQPPLPDYIVTRSKIPGQPQQPQQPQQSLPQNRHIFFE